MRTILALTLLAPLTGACGGTGENIDTEGCMYLENGPFTAVTAGAAMDTSAPAVTAAEGGFTVTLPASGVGYLSFDSPDDTEYAFFTNRPVAVAAFTPSGTSVPPAASMNSSDVCATIQGRHIIELPVGLFYIGLGPDSGGPVNFVLRPYNPD